MQTTPTDQPHDDGWYEIRLRGRLDTRWSARLDGMDLAVQPDGTTILRGPVVDQAALHGLLARVRDLGLPLISITEVPFTRQLGTPTAVPTHRTQETDMTITAARSAAEPTTADPSRNNARAAGIFYLLTFASSIPALLLIDPVLSNPDYIVSAGNDTRVLWGCFLDLVNATTAVASAVAVYPIVKRQNQSLALGFVTSRMFEAAVIVTGIISLLTVVMLRQDFAGTTGSDSVTLTTIGQALVTVRDWTFLFGPGFMVSVNAVLFGTLLYRSGLVPRAIPMMGLIGAPVLLGANLLTFFGHNSQTSAATVLATVPIFFWELSVGVYLTVKGFKRTPITPEATA